MTDIIAPVVNLATEQVGAYGARGIVIPMMRQRRRRGAPDTTPAGG